MVLNINNFSKHRLNRGANIIEYVLLIVIVLSALYVMRETITRGFFAKHKLAGDSFAFGRQYDAKRSTVCKRDVISYDYGSGNANYGPWYDEDCYHTRVTRAQTGNPATGGCRFCNPGDKACFACEDAIKNSCQNPYCTMVQD